MLIDFWLCVFCISLCAMQYLCGVSESSHCAKKKKMMRGRVATSTTTSFFSLCVQHLISMRVFNRSESSEHRLWKEHSKQSTRLGLSVECNGIETDSNSTQVYVVFFSEYTDNVMWFMIERDKSNIETREIISRFHSMWQQQ